MITTVGLTRYEIRRGKALLEDGKTLQDVCTALNCSAELVQNLCMPKQAVAEADPIHPDPAMVGGRIDSDEHGPLPGSPEWNALSPQQKGALTKARQRDED
jgi:hypothetical protein